MAKNLSVRQFQQLMERLPKDVGLQLQEAVEQEANQLVFAMRSAAPYKTGKLRASIRTGPARSNPLKFVIFAGGELTTKEVRKGSGVPYDYALGTEWGTEKESARPFFYSTARAKRRPIQIRLSGLAKAAIEKLVPSP
jgi:HK97 gp10 family phage protein